MKKLAIKKWDELEDRVPAYALVADVDLVVVRYDESVSVLYGRCAHRGALMSDGSIDGNNLICGVHGWDYRLDSGISQYNNSETLPKFNAWLEDGQVFVDEDQIAAWVADHPQPYNRDAYQGLFQDPTGTVDEPHVKFIRMLANDGLSKVGHHGPSSAMGVPRDSLPKWDDLQFVVGQLANLPLLDEEAVGTELVIGPAFDITLTDALSLAEARQALAKHVLLTELITGLGKESPSSLGSVKIATTPTGIDSCVRLAKTWRQLRDYRDTYVAAANAVEQEYALANVEYNPDTIINLESVLAIEQALLSHVEHQLVDAPTEELLELTKTRLARFWSDVMPSIQAHWALIASAAEVLLEADRVADSIAVDTGRRRQK